MRGGKPLEKEDYSVPKRGRKEGVVKIAAANGNEIFFHLPISSQILKL